MTVEPPVPAPVPPDADLRDFGFMPLDINRLFGSSFHARASDAEWRAGVTLWLKSFHQVPAGSLPAEDIELCRLAEFGRDLRAWGKIKAGAMHGWFLCSDGRLYHATVAEKVNEAWRRKGEQRRRTQKARAAAADRRLRQLPSRPDEARVELPQTESVAGSVTDSVTATKGQGQGQGQGQEDSKSSEPGGSGGTPPGRTDFPGKLFDSGVGWRQHVTGKSNAACRAPMGRWRLDLHDDAPFGPMAEARRQSVPSPRGVDHRRDQGERAGAARRSAPAARPRPRRARRWRGFRTVRCSATTPASRRSTRCCVCSTTAARYGWDQFVIDSLMRLGVAGDDAG